MVRPSAIVSAPEPLKICSKCKEPKPPEDFYPRRERSNGFRGRCKECVCADRAQYRRQDPEKTVIANRNSLLKYHYGLTISDYEELLISQGGVCAGCGSNSPGGRWKNFHVDHDHYCCPGKNSCGKCIRGLLCSSCNLGIGNLGDNPERLRQLADYIEKTRADGR